MKIRVLWAGKTKKPYFRSAIEDYAGRIRKLIPFEIVEIREETLTDHNQARRMKSESRDLAARKKARTSVVLDSTGKTFKSEEFAKWLGGVSDDIDFFIGGPAGFNSEDASLKMSFGPMTLPHELARVVLLEQIYRALTIQRRIPYHK